MRILFISTQPPFPPVDGVRIPAAHHLRALASQYPVDCLLLKCGSQPYSDSDVSVTAKEVQSLTEIDMSPRGTIRACLDEVVLKNPYYGRWEPENGFPESIRSVPYDLAWCATPPAVAVFARESVRSQLSVRHFVAGLSDIHSLVLESRSNDVKSRPPKGGPLGRLMLHIRKRTLKRAEARMLRQFEMCTMQTDRELEWMRGMGEDLAERSLVLSNGVDASCFEVPVERKTRRILFVGILTGVYSDRLSWFIENVWRPVRTNHPRIEFHVVGKGASTEMKSLMKSEGICYRSYIENMTEAYRDSAVVVAPIFKGYGIINKVLEAMASGCLVIGDKTAYNGIPGFADGRHGWIAGTADGFVKRIQEALESPDFHLGIRQQGRQLIKTHFLWENRYDAIRERVSRILGEGSNGHDL